MNQSLELHDSTVSIVHVLGGDLIISFSDAYVHRSFGEPGISAGEGYVQPAELIFSLASWSGELCDARGTISDGHVSIAGQHLSLLPLPFTSRSAVTAELAFASGALLKVSASSVVCKANGAARFVESYSG